MALRRELEHLRRPLEASWEDALNAAFETGVGHERKRIRQALLLPGDAEQAAPVVQPTRGTTQLILPDVQAAQSYGTVTGSVRTAVISLGPTYERGVGPAEITEYCRNTLHVPITKLQVLTALKQLANPKRKEVVRKSRGRYLPGPNVRAGSSGDAAPESGAAE